MTEQSEPRAPPTRRRDPARPPRDTRALPFPPPHRTREGTALPDPAKLAEYEAIVPGLAERLAATFLAEERHHRIRGYLAQATALVTVVGSLAVAAFALNLGA